VEQVTHCRLDRSGRLASSAENQSPAGKREQKGSPVKLPYAPVEFTKSGKAADQDAVDAALELAASAHGGEATDVLLLAHGWNNGKREAEELFGELTDNLAAVARLSTGAAPKFVVVGLLWPSVRWADREDLAGGGLAAGGEVAALLAAIDERVEDPATATRLAELARSVDSSVAARDEFVELVRTLLPDDLDDVADDDPVPDALLTRAPAEVLETVAEAETDVADDTASPSGPGGELPPGMAPDLLGAGETAAAGLDLGDLNPSRLARQLLNLTTYYTMKDRAGKVGALGVAPLVDALNGQSGDRRVHLAGHSFGARVVTAAAAKADTPVASLTLLQAAFSHTAFSSTFTPPGAFRAVLDGRVTGPVVITHTRNDRAVRLAYALASRLARQVGAGVGDKGDPYGGLGANGAVQTEGVVALTMGGADAGYAFSARKVYNLLADENIRNHGDVRNRAVANAWLQAVTVR
jgi:pimeloyl-ACP methyl ester carboxylesterase